MAWQQVMLQFILLAASFLFSDGLSLIKTGSQQFYIQLDVKALCNTPLNYLGYSNNTCNAGLGKKNEARSSGLILVSGANSVKNDVSRRWTVKLKKKENDGTYLAVISNELPKSSKLGRPRCLGSISLANPGICKSGKFAERVFIEEDGKEVWRIIPLADSSDTVVIVAKNREPGCLRYLGANKECSNLLLKLYADFDGSGLQRWKLIPVEVQQQQQQQQIPPPVPLQSPPAVKTSPPPLPIPIIMSPPALPLLLPGKPTNVKALPTATSSVAIITWEDGPAALGSTDETYAVKCVAAFGSCDGLQRGISESGIARGTQRGIVTGLAYRKELIYTCYVVASNTNGSICSDGIELEAPDPPTNIISTFSSKYTWAASWDVGTAGYPEEIYSLKCVQRGAGCEGRMLVTSTIIIQRWTRQGSVELPADTSIDCYVIAESSAGRACSAPVPIITPRRGKVPTSGRSAPS